MNNFRKLKYKGVATGKSKLPEKKVSKDEKQGSKNTGKDVPGQSDSKKKNSGN